MSAQPNNHNIKMKLDGGFQYGVIQFLQRPNPRIPPYVCVPHSWILVRHSTVKTDTTRAASIVSFPDNEDALVTERRILQNEKASDRWKLYSAIVIYESHTFEDASKYMMMMAKADIAQEKIVINNDVRPMATPSTSTSVPALEHNKLTHPLNTTNLNKSKQHKEKTVMNVSNPTKAAQITNFMPPISVKPLNLDIAKSVAGETGMISRRNSIQTFQNSNDSLRYGHHFQRPMTNHDIGIPRIDPNEPAIRVEHGSQHVAENKQDASQVPLILRQLLLDNVEPVSFSREYVALLQRINNVHSKQTPPANLSVSQKQGSDMKPVASITIENPDSVAAQPRMVINSFPNYQNVSHIATGPSSNNNSQNLINVASCSYSANQSDVAVESPMEVEKEENTFRESNTEAAASINTEPQENHAFDSMLNIWINNAADLFQAMHSGISQSRVITSDFEKALERTNGQFEYFANLFDNLRKLTKRNTDENTEETRKNTVQDNLVNDCDMRETTESTKSADLSDYNCCSDESGIYKDDDDDNENENDKVDGNYRSFTLPPEYDPDDTRWTLKHQKGDPERGIVELIPGKNVYIDEIKLAHCKRESQEYKKLGRKLLEEIFNPSALNVCSLTGARANAFAKYDKNVRPGLDAQGRLAILDYIENYGSQKGWGVFDMQVIINSLRSRLQEIRYKHSKTDAK